MSEKTIVNGQHLPNPERTAIQEKVRLNKSWNLDYIGIYFIRPSFCKDSDSAQCCHVNTTYLCRVKADSRNIPSSLISNSFIFHGAQRMQNLPKEKYPLLKGSHRTSGAAAAAMSLLIGCTSVSTSRPSKMRRHHEGGSRGRWPSWREG